MATRVRSGANRHKENVEATANELAVHVAGHAVEDLDLHKDWETKCLVTFRRALSSHSYVLLISQFQYPFLDCSEGTMDWTFR